MSAKKHRTRQKSWLPWLCLLVIIALAVAIRIHVIFDYGPYLTLHSDDEGYYRSAQWLLKNGIYAYYSPKIPTVHMMPGIVLYLAFFIHWLGTGAIGHIVARIGMIIISAAGMIALFLIGRQLWSPWCGIVAVLILGLYVPSIVTDNLFLTETPFMTAFLYLVYCTLKAAKVEHSVRWSSKWVYFAAMFYVICIYFRPTVALFPILILIYFLLYRYPRKSLVKHAIAGFFIVILMMSPWWIRNELTFQRFIPTTDGMGNPVLLGTFQGQGFPASTPNTVLEQLVVEHPNVVPKSEHSQTLFEDEDKAAILRMQLWWKTHPGEFINSYLHLKPVMYWAMPYYPLTIFRLKIALLTQIQAWLVIAGLTGWSICLVFGKGVRKEALFVLSTMLYYTVLYSFFFVYGRYNEPLMPLVFLGIPGGIYTLLRPFFWRGRHRMKSNG